MIPVKKEGIAVPLLRQLLGELSASARESLQTGSLGSSLGNLSGLPPLIQKDIREAEEDTKDFTGLTVVLAVNYGGRDEIVRAASKLAASGKTSITEEDIGSALDMAELPDVDLLIRTGGEKRLSNFLMWKSAYAELVFSDTLWPDYGKEEFLNDIAEYQRRTRKFGAVLDDKAEGGKQ